MEGMMGHRSRNNGFVGLWVIAFSFGCSGDKNDGEGAEDFSCAFEAELSGALVRELPLEEMGCVYPLSFDAGLTVHFGLLREPNLTIILNVEEIAVAEVGEFPARVSFIDENDNRFVANDCTVSVTTHEPDPEGGDDLGAPYRLVGTGKCSTFAENTIDPSQTVHVSDFQFAAPAVWNE